MRQYHKIETVFNRDIEGTKKLIEGSYRNKTVEYLKNCMWEFSEKIDGTNIRVHWDGHKVSFGGRSDTSSIPAHLANKLIELFGTPEVEELFEQVFGEKEVILFGEGYGPKIQNGGAYRSNVDFILFDVMVNGKYLSRDNVKGIAKTFGIDCVPVAFIGTLEQGIETVKNQPKSLIGNCTMEGFVARPLVELLDENGNRVIVKIKVRDFC